MANAKRLMWYCGRCHGSSQYCEKEFCQRTALIKHLRVHTGERPYSCTAPGCHKTFSQSSNLIRHQRVHSGERPYVCPLCQKSFISGSNLKQHQEVHKADTHRDQFICKLCQRSFLYPASFKKHFQGAHGKEFEEYLRTKDLGAVCEVIKVPKQSARARGDNNIKEEDPEEAEDEKKVQGPYLEPRRVSPFPIASPVRDPDSNQPLFLPPPTSMIESERVTLQGRVVQVPGSQTPLYPPAMPSLFPYAQHGFCAFHDLQLPLPALPPLASLHSDVGLQPNPPQLAAVAPYLSQSRFSFPYFADFLKNLHH